MSSVASVAFSRAPCSHAFVPTDISYPRFLYNRSSRFADRIALIDDQTGRQCSYKDFWRLVGKFAVGLRTKGLSKGDRVCVVSSNCFEYPVIISGVASLGGVLVPLNPLYTSGELTYYLKDAEPDFIICSPDAFDSVRKASTHSGRSQVIFTIGPIESGYTSYEDLLRLGGDNEINDPEQFMDSLNPTRDLMSVFYSSGTTGYSKGCMHTHYNYIANNIQSSESSWPIFVNGKDITIATAPMYHMYGMILYLSEGLANGCTLVITPRFQADKYVSLVEKYQATVMVLVPPALAAISESQLVNLGHLASVKRVLSAASPLRQDIVEAFQKLIPDECIIIEHYGSTECMTISSHCVSGKHVIDDSVGYRLPCVQLKIVDLKTDRPLGPNENGEILVRSPSLLVGYWKNRQTMETVIDGEGYFRTGDFGHFDGDENLHLVDRIKDLIKYNGFQVNPTELESLLLTHPSVREVAVVGKPHRISGELPTAFIVTSDEVQLTGKPSLERMLTEFLAARVSPWKRLRGGIRIVESLPRSPSGKILKRQLRCSLEKESEQEQASQKSNL